jgi:hypothetical protein
MLTLRTTPVAPVAQHWETCQLEQNQWRHQHPVNPPADHDPQAAKAARQKMFCQSTLSVTDSGPIGNQAVIVSRPINTWRLKFPTNQHRRQVIWPVGTDGKNAWVVAKWMNVLPQDINFIFWVVCPAGLFSQCGRCGSDVIKASSRSLHFTHTYVKVLSAEMKFAL